MRVISNSQQRRHYQAKIGRIRPSLLAIVAFCGVLGLAGVAHAKDKPPREPKAPRNAPAALVAPNPISIDIPYEKFTLANGLRVIVHTDKKAPVVAVGIWYHVGSKDERPGRTGFAHLFEHLMFQGTENFKDEWINGLENIGATDLNGTTWFDRTNYFQTVPKTALDLILWLESDRMGHFINSVDQAKLDEQRGVVQNEKRQGDNQPYGRLEYSELAGLFPGGHPYSWSTIGSLEDLQAASLADVKEWFANYYGPSNAVLVLAGDVDVETAKKLTQTYFGDIPAGPPIARRLAAVPQRTINTRDRIEDKVPQTMIERAWATPGRTTREAALLELASEILGGGKTSRLYKSLVADQQLATQATMNAGPFELASIPSANILVRPEVDAGKAEAALDKVFADFIANGPNESELQRAKTSITAGFVRGAEKVGGFAGKTTILGESELYAGDPGFYKQYLGWIQSATAKDVQDFARQYLANGWHQVNIVPVPAYSAAAKGVDRSKVPTLTATPDLTFPAVETATLSNGMKVSLARRTSVPVIELSMVFDAGYAADTTAKPGLAAFTLDMLDEGTLTRSSQDIAEEAERLGAQISTGSNLDLSSARLSALKDNFAPSLALLGDILRNPAFKQADFDRVKAARLAGIAQEKAQPQGLAFRLLPPALYGAEHPYGKPFSGSGTEASLNSLTPADLRNFKETWLRPDNVTIFAAGDTTMAELTSELEKALAGWNAPATAKPVKTIANVPQKASRVVMIDRADSPQTLILAGRLAPTTAAPNNIALTTANDILGGNFASRINLNLRESKSWSYGAFTFLQDAKGQRPLIVFAPVQTDKTAESIAELRKEFSDFNGKRPASAAEIAQAVNSASRSLPGQFETNGAVLNQMIADYRFGRPADFASSLKAQYNALNETQIRDAGKELIKSDDLIWIVIGDAKKIEAGVRAAGLGPLEIWDTDGKRLK